jgi:hypothetical protein
MSNALAWAGRTTVKCRRSSVATCTVPSLSATATTDASTAPSGRLAFQQPTHLGQHWRGDHQRTTVPLQQLATPLMVSVVRVEGCHQRPRIDNDHAERPNSARMISSDRAARSPFPLRNAPANDSRRTGSTGPALCSAARLAATT